MKVLISGATGHIGTNVVRLLRARGHAPVPFVRPSSNLEPIAKVSEQPRYGDTTDRSALENAASDCSAIIHLATPTAVNSKYEELMAAALLGTQNVLRAAHACGVDRVVYASSAAAVGLSDNPNVLRNEDDWNESAINPYFVAKVRAERSAWDLANELDVKLVVLCPSVVFGPHDYRFGPVHRMLTTALNRHLPTIRTGFNIVSVTDVAETFVAALTKGVPGERYLVGGLNIHGREIGQCLARLCGVRVPHIEASGQAMSLLAWVWQMVESKLGRTPSITPSIVDEFYGRFGYYDTSKAQRLWRTSRTDARAILAPSIAWSLFRGWIRPRLAKRIAARFPPDPSW